MPFYQKLGQIPRKHHIWFHRNGAAPTFKNEGIAYEHVITTEGFNEAYSIMYHLRPPTRVRSVKLLKCEELKKAADSPLRHHHLRTANIARKGDLYSGRIPILFNQDMTAWRARPEKPYGKFQYYKNGGADEIIFVFKGGGTVETMFGKQRYRAEDYIVIPRGITYRLVPDKVEEEDYLILESAGPVRIPKRYLNQEGQIKMGAPYSERDFHGPSGTEHNRQGRGHGNSGEGRSALDLRDDGASSVRCRRLGRLRLSVHVQRAGFRTDHRHGASTAADPSNLRDSRLRRLHIRAALFGYASRGGENSVGARQRRSGRSFVLRARKFWIAPWH